tara:strand:+ start:11912 stop:12790 length:879 start_codon:yes stop_codon:yes gene_type:complete
MHKKLETDLMSLAHSILQMKNKENVFLLKQKAHEIYEKLSVLAFVEEYVNATPNLKDTKEELTAVVKKAYENKKLVLEELAAVEEKETVIEHVAIAPLAVENIPIEPVVGDNSSEEEVQEEVKDAQSNEVETKENEMEDFIAPLEEIEKAAATEQPFDALENLIFEDTTAIDSQEEVTEVLEPPALTLEEELADVISVDLIADLFEPLKPTSLNNKLQANIHIDLNDRIVFVKNLFDGSQEDFNRVVSQLNSFKTEKEAKKFINKMVKPDYDWKNHEALENRFITIIERRFS